MTKLSDTLMGESEERTLQERFERYRDRNPEIYAQFKMQALALFEKGVTRYSAKAIMEVVRFNSIMSGRRTAVNNSFTSRYARMLMAEDPRFEHFFETRKLLSVEE